MVTKNIAFKHTNSDTDASIRPLVEQKLAGLARYVGNETDVKTDVEFEKVSSSKSGKLCRVEVNIAVRGEIFRAEATEETFEAALDVVKDELDREMDRSQKKRNSLLRRGGRKLKEMMRYGK